MTYKVYWTEDGASTDVRTVLVDYSLATPKVLIAIMEIPSAITFAGGSSKKLTFVISNYILPLTTKPIVADSNDSLVLTSHIYADEEDTRCNH